MRLTQNQIETWEYIIQVRRAQRDLTPIELIVKMRKYPAEEKSQIEKEYGVELKELPELKMTIAYIPINVRKVRRFLESPYVKDWQFPGEVEVAAS